MSTYGTNYASLLYHNELNILNIPTFQIRLKKLTNKKIKINKNHGLLTHQSPQW